MTSEDIQTAEAIVREWFWQPDSWHRKSVVRYYESAPIQPDVLQLVIAYLKQQETDRLFILNKELPLGETWKATDAWFQTSPSDKWAGTESTKIRIYQAFKPKADESDGPYTVENGCKYLVTHKFHWDVAAIPTLPASSSGVNYTLQGVTRDKETGHYSCVIEKRETVQQDVELYDTAKTIFETVQNEQHLGVKQNDVASTGQQASAANGALVKRLLRKNPDCTTDVVNETTIEEPVSGATVEYRKTLRGTVETTTDRNQATAVTASTEPLAVGETRRSEKTPGGRFINTVQQVTAEPAGTILKSCAKSGNVSHNDVEVENVAAEDAPSSDHVVSDKNKVVKQSVRKTEEGTVDVETETTQYSEVTATSTSTFATETAVTTVKRHSTPTNNEVAATLGYARAEPDETGAVTSSITEYTPTATDSAWITWDSQTETPSGTFKYHHGVRIFKNQNKTWLQSAKPTGGSNVSINANVNKFGLYDGSIAYTDLYEWNTSGSGTGGGSQAGTYTFYEFKQDATGRRWRRQVTVATRAYYGRGNEGSEAQAAANDIGYPGMHLPGRTYATAAPVPGEWTTVGA